MEVDWVPQVASACVFGKTGGKYSHHLYRRARERYIPVAIRE